MTVLSELKVGDTGVLVALDLPESVQNHLMHMGFVPDAEVTALRHETAEAIRVSGPHVEPQPVELKTPPAPSASLQSEAAELIEASR